MTEELRVLKPREYHKQLVLKGQRVDGRGLEELRDIKVEIDAIRTADSSSLVKIGNTSLVCGCNAKVVECQNPDKQPNPINITVTLPPICSILAIADKYEHTSQLLTRILNNIFEDSNCLITEGFDYEHHSYLWVIDVEVICLNYDGFFIDAALIAILTALRSIPLYQKGIKTTKRYLKFNSLPITSSFAVIGGRVVCDPNHEEETVAQSTFSITIDLLSDRLCQINKVGGKAVSTTKLLKCIELAKQRTLKVSQSIGSFLIDKSTSKEQDMIID